MDVYRDKVLQSVRTTEHYLKEYQPKNMIHRTWVVNNYLKNMDNEVLVKEKWTITDLKKVNIFLDSGFITRVLEGTVSETNKFVVKGMLELAAHKAILWNTPRYDKADIPVAVPEFNPGSAKQLQEFFDMLKIEAITTSGKTGKASWNRDNIELLYKTETNEELLEVLQAIIDHSFSGIIKNNFLAAFDSFTVDGDTGVTGTVSI